MGIAKKRCAFQKAMLHAWNRSWNPNPIGNSPRLNRGDSRRLTHLQDSNRWKVGEQMPRRVREAFGVSNSCCMGSCSLCRVGFLKRRPADAIFYATRGNYMCVTAFDEANPVLGLQHRLPACRRRCHKASLLLGDSCSRKHPVRDVPMWGLSGISQDTVDKAGMDSSHQAARAHASISDSVWSVEHARSGGTP